MVKDALRDFAGPGTQLGAIECRASACEVRVIHDTEDDYVDFMRRAFKGHGFQWTGEVFVTKGDHDLPGGKKEMVVFLARPDGRLPHLD
jgi:hypothetical protein